LGDKWPAIDFYVELTGVPGRRPYFFVQAKSTTAPLTATAKILSVSTKKEDVDRLLCMPGPTYILGVHEPTKRVFARSVHAGTTRGAISVIPLAHELTSVNLQRLHDEVRDFWQASNFKPKGSVFK
jgi:hypothetical protein